VRITVGAMYEDASDFGRAFLTMWEVRREINSWFLRVLLVGLARFRQKDDGSRV
jgi:hypothetical protein